MLGITVVLVALNREWRAPWIEDENIGFPFRRFPSLNSYYAPLKPWVWAVPVDILFAIAAIITLGIGSQKMTARFWGAAGIRLSRIAVAVMVSVTAALTWLNFNPHSHGRSLGYTRGVPLEWFFDMGGPPRIAYGALLGDAAVALFCVLAFGGITELLVKRFNRSVK